MTRLLVLHGPNLNLLGTREPEVYGRVTLPQIDQALADRAADAGVELASFQSNHEGALVDRIQSARTEQTDFILINPAAYTHTSVAIRDALAGVGIPFVEIHLSNVHRREPFRHHSYFSDQAEGVICGLGWKGYLYALEFALDRLRAPARRAAEFQTRPILAPATAASQAPALLRIERGFLMDLRKLKTLIDLVSESGISELEVTEGEGKVRIVKNAPPVYVQPSASYCPQ